MAHEDRRGRTISAIVGAGAGTAATLSVTALSGGRPADVQQDTAQHNAPPAQVIRQETDDRKQLLALLDKIAAYKRYDERDYTEIWEMHRDAGASGERQHRGFVDAALKVGGLVGKAQDSAKKLRKNTDYAGSTLKEFRAAAGEVMDLHFSGRDPLQLAMSEVPVKYWPEDRLQEGVARYDAFLADVKTASGLVRKLGLDREAENGQTEPGR
jgi:hypothetical protein